MHLSFEGEKGSFLTDVHRMEDIAMILKEKEKTVIQDLQTQEKSCVEKYGRYADLAKDPELKSLFQKIQKDEQKHYDSLTQVLDGQVPQV